MRLYTFSRLGVVLAAAALSAAAGVSASAQSTFAFQGIYAGTDNGFWANPFNGSANNANNPFIGSKSWSGMDSQGNQQTMTAQGTVWSNASYGKMHIFADASVNNPYYNAANPAYFNENMALPDDNGSPDLIAVHGNAGFSDKFTYTGTQQSGYKVNYWFRLTGSVIGDTEAGLNFASDYPADGVSHWNVFRTSAANELWITGWYDVLWGVETNVYADFYGGLTTHVSQRPEGGVVIGFGDYSHTLELEKIQIVDPFGNLFSDWDMTSASGAQYNLFRPRSSVPEPGTAALALAASAIGIVLRRSRRQG